MPINTLIYIISMAIVLISGGYCLYLILSSIKIDRKEEIMKKWQGCRGCSEYSYHLSRCKLGRINPRTLKQALSASAIMGTEYICNHNGMNWKVTEARKNENNPDNN